jgi:hypothetical protein
MKFMKHFKMGKRYKNLGTSALEPLYNVDIQSVLWKNCKSLVSQDTL